MIMIKSKKALEWSQMGWFILFVVFLLVGIVIIILATNKSNPILSSIKNLLRFG